VHKRVDKQKYMKTIALVLISYGYRSIVIIYL